MGALFSQLLVRTTQEQFVDWVREHDCFLVGTSPGAAVNFRQIKYRPPTIIFIGGERKGLSSESQAACHQIVRIPMTGETDSLNMSVAASVILYEIFNQRSGTATAL